MGAGKESESGARTRGGFSMPKNIIIFSDGTGQAGGITFDEVRTNVYKLFRACRVGPDTTIEPSEQVTFYDPGLGSPADGSRIKIQWARAERQAVASEIKAASRGRKQTTRSDFHSRQLGSRNILRSRQLPSRTKRVSPFVGRSGAHRAGNAEMDTSPVGVSLRALGLIKQPEPTGNVISDSQKSAANLRRERNAVQTDNFCRSTRMSAEPARRRACL